MRAALIVAMFAVLFRLVPCLDSERPHFSDERDYDRLARTLASSGRYEEEGRPTAQRPVGYPVVVAAIYRAVGERPEAVKVFQAFLGGGTAFLLFLLFRGRGTRTALLASALWAAYPPAILYAQLLRPETLVAFLLVASAVALSRERSLSGTGRFVLGVFLGLAALVKMELALLLASIPFVLEAPPQRLRRAATILAGAAVVIAPWIARNAIEVGAPMLSTNLGPNLLIGNHPGAAGGYSADIPDSMRPRATGEAAASAESFRIAARYIAENPGESVVRVARKWAFLLMSESELVVTAFHRDPGDPATPFRDKARSLPVWLHLAVSVPYAAIFLLGTLGLLGSRSGPERRFFMAVVATWFVVHGVTFGGSRFNFPWMPFLAAYAAAWMVERRLGLSSRPAWSVVLAATLCVLAIAVWVAEARVIWGGR